VRYTELSWANKHGKGKKAATKSGTKKKSNRSAFMKGLMRSFAKHDPEKISTLYVDKKPDELRAAFMPIVEDIVKWATPKDKQQKSTDNDEK
jgi:hypothetical protein